MHEQHAANTNVGVYHSSISRTSSKPDEHTVQAQIPFLVQNPF